jgi:hypothetical protein
MTKQSKSYTMTSKIELQVNECTFCNRSFQTEKSLIDHSCEQKRRWFQKDEVHVRLAFIAWTRFYELGMPYNRKIKKDYREFSNSQYYIAFVKFGRHISESNVIEPQQFIDFVIKGNIPLHKWTHESVLDEYIKTITRQESLEDGLERTIKTMLDWSNKNSETWNDFFRKINPNVSIQLLRTGRISPWVLYNADSAIDLFERCSEEHLNMIKKIAPIASWKIRFNKHANEVKFIRQLLSESGI